MSVFLRIRNSIRGFIHPSVRPLARPLARPWLRGDLVNKSSKDCTWSAVPDALHGVVAEEVE